jgi:hypothetical protein
MLEYVAVMKDICKGDLAGRCTVWNLVTCLK